jgi:MFS family permease
VQATKTSEVHRFYQLLLLAAAAWSVIYARFALAPLQEAMRIDLGMTDTQMAWLQGPAVALPLAFGAIPAGLLVDRYPRAPLFMVFVVLNLVGTVLTAVTSNMLVLVCARMLTGLSLAVVLVTAFSVVSDLYEPTRRGRATMVVFIGEIAGSPAAFALGGTLLVMGSSMSALGFEGWRWALLWMSAPLLLCAFLVLGLREPARTGVIVKNPPLLKVLPELWRYRTVVVTLLTARMTVWVGDGAVMVWGAPTFERYFGLSPQETGAAMAMALLVSGVLGPVLGGPLADYCERRGGSRRTITVLAFSMLLSAPAALFALAPTATFATVALTVFLLIGFIGQVAAMATATIIIPGELRGLYIAITLALASVFSFGLAPLMVSWVSAALGGPSKVGHALAIIGAGTAVLGAIAYGSGRKYFPATAEERRVNETLIVDRA